MGKVARFALLPGQPHNTIGLPPPIEDLSIAAMIGDRAFDNNAIVADLDKQRAEILIASSRPRQAAWRLLRHLTERFPEAYPQLLVR